MKILQGRPTLVCPCVGFQNNRVSREYRSFFLIVSAIGGIFAYHSQNLLRIALSILVHVPSSFLTRLLGSEVSMLLNRRTQLRKGFFWGYL